MSPSPGAWGKAGRDSNQVGKCRSVGLGLDLDQRSVFKSVDINVMNQTAIIVNHLYT